MSTSRMSLGQPETVQHQTPTRPPAAACTPICRGPCCRAGSPAVPARSAAEDFRGHRITRAGGGGEEAERVEVAAAQRVRLDDGVGSGSAEPQRDGAVPPVVGPLSVDHGPLVQAEAAELGGRGGGGVLQPTDELGGGSTLGDERGQIHRRHPGVGPVETAGGRVLAGGVQQSDPRARVPLGELRRPQPVVVEQEVLDRMLAAGGDPGEVIGEQGAHRVPVRVGQWPPLRRGKHAAGHPNGIRRPARRRVGDGRRRWHRTIVGPPGPFRCARRHHPGPVEWPPRDRTGDWRRKPGRRGG